MPLNTGVTGGEVRTNDGFIVRYEINYDHTVGVNPDGSINPEDQPIIDRGDPPWALRVTNTSPRVQVINVTGPSGKLLGRDGTENFEIDPGETIARASFLASRAGIRTRADIAFTMRAS